MGNFGILILFAAAALVFAGGSKVIAADKNNNCGIVKMTPDMLIANLDRIVAVASSFKPNDPGFEALQRLMQIVAPGCPWNRDTKATLIGANGATFEWSKIVELAGARTIAELDADPEFQGIMHPGQGDSVSPDSTSTQAAGYFMGITKS